VRERDEFELFLCDSRQFTPTDFERLNDVEGAAPCGNRALSFVSGSCSAVTELVPHLDPFGAAIELGDDGGELLGCELGAEHIEHTLQLERRE
jgi:hypothetical protein